MHLVSTTTPVNLGPGMGILEAGEWLCHDTNAFQIANIAPKGTVQVNHAPYREGAHREDKPRLIMRSGSIGDLLMLTPSLRALKARGEKIVLSCFEFHRSQFDGTELVDEFVPYPLSKRARNQFSLVVDLGNLMEVEKVKPAQDVFAEALGVATPLDDYRPSYVVTEFEKEAAKKHVFTNRPTLAVQPVASVPNRNYGPEKMFPVLFELEKRGWGIVMLGRKNQVPMLPPHLQTPYMRNLSVHDLPLRESVAVLANCDAFLGPDSSFMHFAAALNIPAVSLHGPFPWQIRTAGYPNNLAITGTGECAGCCWNLHAGMPFPPDKPCAQTHICSVMSSIDPSRVVAKVDALRRK